jgi:hypothetical protein
LRVLAVDIEQKHRHIRRRVKRNDSISATFALPRPANRIFRAPPVPGMISPASGFDAMNDTIACRSSSLTCSSVADAKKAGVSMTVCMLFSTALPYKNQADS